jgi:periplasmic divalent cation tolerance protein
MTDKVVVLSTAGSQAEAARIAEELLEKRLAACVNIVGRIQSFYLWHDKLQRDEEFLMIIKTCRAKLDQVQDAIREMNSYELPEFIALSVEGGSDEYLRWLDTCVGKSSERPNIAEPEG